VEYITAELKEPEHSDVDEDNTAESLELQLAPIRLLSCYMAYDHSGPPPNDTTKSLIKDCETRNINFIVGCDANAHHSQLG